MRRHEQKPRQSLGAEHSSQNESGDATASSLGSTISRNTKIADSANPGSSLKANVKSVMPLESSHFYEVSARAIRDAMVAESTRLRIPPSWTDIPKIKDLFQARSKESQRVLLEPVRLPEPGGVRLTTPAFGKFVKSHQSDKPGSNEAAIESSPLPERGSTGREAFTRLSGPAERRNLASPDSNPIPASAPDRSSQPPLELSQGGIFAGNATSVPNLVQALMRSEAAWTPVEMPSSPTAGENTSLINPTRFQTVFSALSENTGLEAPSPDNSANGDASSSVVSQANSIAEPDSSSLASMNLSNVSGKAFAPFLGDQPGLTVSGQDTNATAMWASDPSQSISTLNSFGPVSTPFGTSDPTSGQGLDLSKTNELLQQLLDEFRKGLQSYLPLTDRNSSTF